MTGNDTADKLRAVFLTVLMIGSVVGATVAFSGGAVAAAGNDASVSLDGSGPAYVAPGAANTVVEQIIVTDGGDAGNSDTTISSFQVNNQGTATSDDISSVKVYEDSDTDGEVDASDPQVASEDSFGSLDATTADVVGDNSQRTYLVVVDTTGDATDANTIKASTQVTVADSGSHFAGGTTTSGTYTAGSATEIDAAPTIESATTADSDNNGQIDQLTVGFSEAVSVADTDPSNGIDGLDVTGYSVDGVVSGDGTTSITFSLAESESDDTGATPDVKYSQSGGLEDADQQPKEVAAYEAQSASDGAAPVISNYQVTNDGDDIVVSFDASESLSEPSVSVTGPEGYSDSKTAGDEGGNSYSATFTPSTLYEGTYTGTLSSPTDGTNEASDETGKVIVGDIESADITSEPAKTGATGVTHTTDIVLKNQKDIQDYEFVYSGDVDVSDVDKADVVALKVDVNNDDDFSDDIDMNLLDSNSKSSGLDKTDGSGDGTVLTLGTSSSVTIPAGARIHVEYKDVDNPTFKDTNVQISLDPDTPDVQFDRPLTLGGAAENPTVDNAKVGGTSVDSGSAVLGTSANGTNTAVLVTFSEEMSDAGTVSLTVDGQSVPVNNGTFGESGTTYTGDADIDASGEVNATLSVSGSTDSDDGLGLTDTYSKDFTIDVSPVQAQNASLTATNTIDVAFNDTVKPAEVDESDFDVNTGTTPSKVAVDENVVTLTLSEGDSLAADATPSVSVSAESLTDDAGNDNVGADLTATDEVAPTLDSPALSNPDGDILNVTFDSNEALSSFDVAVINKPGDVVTRVGSSNFTNVADEGSYTYATNVSVPDGQYAKLQVNATDANDNDVSEVELDPDDQYVDTSGPTFELNNVEANTLVSSVPDPITVDVSDENGINANSVYVTVEDDSGTVVPRVRAQATDADAVSYDSKAEQIDISTAGLDLSGQVDVTVEAADASGYGNTSTLSFSVDSQAASGLDVTSPAQDTLLTSDDKLEISYAYNDANPDSVQVKLTQLDGANTYTYDINDSKYTDDGTQKTFYVDLDDAAEDLADGSYAVSVVVEDSASNTAHGSAPGVVTVDDTAPTVSGVSVSDEGLTPGGDVNVTYKLDDASDVSSVEFLVYNESNGSVAMTHTNSTLKQTGDVADAGSLVTADSYDPGASTNHKVDYEVQGSGGEVKQIALNYQQTDVQSVGKDDLTLKVNGEEKTISQASGDGTTRLVITLENKVSVSDGDSISITSSGDAFVNPSNSGTYSAQVSLLDSNEHTVESQTGTLPIGTDTADTRNPTEYVQPLDVSGLDDEEQYNVVVVATDAAGQTSDDPYDGELNLDDDSWHHGSAVNSEAFGINRNAPAISSVEAEVGSDTVTVDFSEAVWAADGSISKDDFAYQDVSGDGASEIESVDASGPAQSVTLHLDEPVAASDLDADLVSSIEDAFVDTEYDAVARSTGVTNVPLQDTEKPNALITDAGPITAANASEYNVGVDVGEPATVTVKLSDGSDTVEEPAEITDSGTVTLDASGLAEGSVDVTATVSDAADNENEQTVTVTKDTNGPTVTSVTGNAGSTSLTVEFNETVAQPSADDFSVVHEGTTLDVSDVHDWSESSTTYTVELSEPLPNAAFDDTPANLTATGVTDVYENDAQGDKVAIEDGAAPSLWGVDAINGSNTVTLTFSENVTANDGDAPSAANLTYTDENDGGATGIESVAYGDSHDTLVVTLNDTVSASDLGNDTIGVGADQLVDAVDKPVAEQSLIVEDGTPPEVSLETSVDDESSTVTVNVTSSEELSTLSVDVWYDHQLAHEDSVVSKTLTVENFTEVSENKYQATYDAPRDGDVHVSVDSAADVAGNDASEWYALPSTAVSVDHSAPSVVDSDIVDAGDGDTAVRVLFDEPTVPALPSDATDDEWDAFASSSVTVEGVSDEDVSIIHSRPSGVLVHVDQNLDTSDAPNVTVDSTAFVEMYSDEEQNGLENTTAGISTAELDLQEGKNFVSVPAATGSLNLSSVDTSNVDAIWTYEDGEWLTYTPGKAAELQGFTSLEGGQGYIFVMNSSDTIDVNVHNTVSDTRMPNQQQLHEGWNLVGSYQEGPQSAGNAFGSAESVYRVLGQQPGANDYTYVNVKSDEDVEPGQAYWVFVQDDEVYVETPWGGSSYATYPL